MIKKRNYFQKCKAKAGSILLTLLAIGMIGATQMGCNYGFESAQEPHENPYDPMYYSTDGRLILGEPEITEGTTNTIRIHWKAVHTNGISGSDYSYTAYYFTDAEKDQVFDLLRKHDDPSASLILITTALDAEKEPDERFFEHTDVTLGQNYYYIVKFSATDATEPSFSNIVVYPPPGY